jgi:pyrimidine-nucleoside phosphorylase
MTGMYEIIGKKRDGRELSGEEIAFFIERYVQGEIPDYQMAALLMAIYLRGMNDRELADLTETMIRSGETLSLEGFPGKTVDKHSTGGVGDKLSFVVAPLTAACGVGAPMLSGRGLGHTGGTLDKLASVPGINVFLNTTDFRQVLIRCGMVISGQTNNIVPADKKLYALRDATATVSSIPLIASSIMSKKLAVKSGGLVLDVKTGSGAFMSGERRAIDLCQTLIRIGTRAGRPTVALVTNMDQPLGRAVGNALEMVEAIETLKGGGSADVLEVSLALSAQMVMMAGKAKEYGGALALVKEKLNSGRALEVFREFLAAQGGDPRVCEDFSLFPQSRLEAALICDKTGYISRIDAFEVGMAAVDIGAGRRKKEESVDPSAGFVFLKNVGDRVQAGEKWITLCGNDEKKVEIARNRLQPAIRISRKPSARPPMILYYADQNGIVPWEKYLDG